MRSSMTSLATGRVRRLLLPLLCAVAALLVASAADVPVPTPIASAATCSDYASQAAAQRAKDTRDADGDGIYCESLPCPCLKPGSTGGGGGGGGDTGEGGSRCGVERWPIKTLSDRAAQRVSFRPKYTTVHRLRTLSSPGVGSGTPRITGVETTTYRIRAQLVEMKREDDRDIHLVIAEPHRRSATMIVEF